MSAPLEGQLRLNGKDAQDALAVREEGEELVTRRSRGVQRHIIKVRDTCYPEISTEAKMSKRSLAGIFGGQGSKDLGLETVQGCRHAANGLTRTK